MKLTFSTNKYCLNNRGAEILATLSYCLRSYNPVHTVYMNVMFLHFFLFTCVRINDDDGDNDCGNKQLKFEAKRCKE